VKTYATNKHFGLVIAEGAGNGLNGTQRDATSDTAPDPVPQTIGTSFFGLMYVYGTDLLTVR